MCTRKLVLVILLQFMCCICMLGQDEQQKVDIIYANAHEYKENGLYEKALEAYKFVKERDPERAKDCDNYIKIINEIISGVFTVSETDIQIEKTGGEYKIKVFGAKKYSVHSDAEWCEPLKHGNIINVVCRQANRSIESRYAEITVYYGNKKKIIYVKQKGADELFRCSSLNLSYQASSTEEKVIISSNVDWNVSMAPSWVIATKTDSNSLLVKVLENSTSGERSGKLLLMSQLGTVREIIVYQSAGKAQLLVSKNDMFFKQDGGTDYIRIITDAHDWDYLNFPAWCQVDKIGKDSLRIFCAPNDPVNLERYGSISISAGNRTIGINISQEARPELEQTRDFIGGRKISLGFSTGYIVPVVTSSSGGNYTGSVVNYALGDKNENAAYKSDGGFTIGAYADVNIHNSFYLTAGLYLSKYAYYNNFDQSYERIAFMYYPMGYYTKGEIRSSYKETYKLTQLELPVLLSYRVPISKMSHLQINVGPSLIYGIAANMDVSGAYDGERIYKYKIVNNSMTNDLYDMSSNPVHFSGVGKFDLYGNKAKYSETNTVGENTSLPQQQILVNDSPYKKVNCALKFGLNYEYEGVNIGIEYSYMLTNMANKKYWDSDRWLIFNQTGNSLMTGYKQKNNYLTFKVGYTFRYRINK